MANYKDVPDYALMAGIPPKKIEWVYVCGNLPKNGLRCKECGREYYREHKAIGRISEY